MSYHAARADGEAGAPLFLTFHGTGGDEHQFHHLARELMPGAYVVSPRGDVNENGMNRYFRRTGEGVYDMDDLARRTAAMADFIEAEKKRTGADRVVAMGYSNGANILVAVMLDRPDLVDDVILMHPLIPWDPAEQPALSGRKVLITAGRRDPICPAAMTEALARYLEGQGTLLTVDWHDGGHEIRQGELAAIQAFLG
ncbi:alpha/beta hydrolase [Alphaproteobacteria bacterium GH1-50]|uniref:Alpha/beta hydrolase n=1 Tax=Kangsaoukella pontilimi TaxID=2691042 RepID=A0A7C9IR95_9RHOB|nr:alpha/beta hydrolase [Kangsaoukella pontilimi]MXQ08523.1 alpha/beta hydrolase [Kangsaoukella pontilimi]